ncbi:uncharacterized protein ARMOST_03943 [Armillaria ostoyae]|uniref:Uncharacterized protein n=1 Tax=Armillaria ostoyae TaxID=47428 RepID=A0A284QVY0_ARMOS|nr:uncharacterized protein ARMOST_03943 [Armillaria ostoyae]
MSPLLPSPNFASSDQHSTSTDARPFYANPYGLGATFN